MGRRQGKEGNDVTDGHNHGGWAETGRFGLGSMYFPEHIIDWAKRHVLSRAEQMLDFHNNVNLPFLCIQRGNGFLCP